MIVNGYKIPDILIGLLLDDQLCMHVVRSELQKETDAYGNHLETEIGEFYKTADLIQQETEKLPDHFQADGYYGEPATDLQGPGAIPDILDFSGIVCFGIAGDGSPICLDYRDNSDQPSVIWWDDVYWRRLAPDFDKFLALFRQEI